LMGLVQTQSCGTSLPGVLSNCDKIQIF
jgi:hypothetical protein